MEKRVGKVVSLICCSCHLVYSFQSDGHSIILLMRKMQKSPSVVKFVLRYAFILSVGLVLYISNHGNRSNIATPNHLNILKTDLWLKQWSGATETCNLLGNYSLSLFLTLALSLPLIHSQCFAFIVSSSPSPLSHFILIFCWMISLSPTTCLTTAPLKRGFTCGSTFSFFHFFSVLFHFTALILLKLFLTVVD